MDVLSDVLRAVRLNGAIFFDHYVQAPFVGGSPRTAAIAGRVMPDAEHVIQFHALLAGSCWAVSTEDPWQCTRLDAGDIVIFPMGDGNVMSSAPGMHAEPNLECTFARLTATCRLFSAMMAPAGKLPLRLRLSRLRRATVQSASRIAAAPVSCANVHRQPKLAGHLLHVAAEETELGGAGSETMLAKLAEVIFVEIIRKHIARLARKICADGCPR